MHARIKRSLKPLLAVYWKQILAASILALLLLAAALDLIPVAEMVDELGITRRNPWAPYLYILAMVVASLLAVPTLFLVVLSGPVFGFWQGLALATLGLNLGTTLTFLVSRRTGQKVTQRLMQKDERSAKISRQIDEHGFWILFYLRLCLVFPYNVLNYLAGTTRIRWKDALAANFMGMLPGTAMYVLLSAKAATVRDHPLQFVGAIVLLIFFIASIHCIDRRRRRKTR